MSSAVSSPPSQPPPEQSSVNPPITQTPQAPAPQEAKPDEKAALQAGIRELMKAGLRGKKTEKKAEDAPKDAAKTEEPKGEGKPAEAKAEPEKPKGDATPAKPEAEPKPKAKKATKPERDSNPEMLQAVHAATDAAQAAKAAVELATKGTHAPEPELSPKLKKALPILEEMEKLYPDQYPKLAERYRESLKKTEAYQAKWEKAHPDDEFDPDAEEHNAFWAANDVEWSEEDYIEAAASIKAEKKVAEERARNEARFKEIEGKTEQTRREPEIRREQSRIAKEFIKGIDKDFAELITDEANLNEKLAETLREKDPITTDMILGAASEVVRFSGEVTKLFDQSLSYKFNPQNQTHAAIATFAGQKEAEMMQQPPQDRLDGQGRTFAPWDQYEKMPPEQQRRHWIFSGEDLIRMFTARVSEFVKETIPKEKEKLELTATRMGFIKAPAKDDAAKTTQNGNGDSPPKPAQATPRHTPPDAGGSPKTETVPVATPKIPTDYRERLKQAFRRR